MAGGWVNVPPGGGGSYLQCSHVGCKKKARQLEADGHDHDCCGKPYHNADHYHAQLPPYVPPPTWGDVFRALLERIRSR